MGWTPFQANTSKYDLVVHSDLRIWTLSFLICVFNNWYYFSRLKVHFLNCPVYSFYHYASVYDLIHHISDIGIKKYFDFDLIAGFTSFLRHYRGRRARASRGRPQINVHVRPDLWNTVRSALRCTGIHRDIPTRDVRLNQSKMLGFILHYALIGSRKQTYEICKCMQKT